MFGNYNPLGSRNLFKNINPSTNINPLGNINSFTKTSKRISAIKRNSQKSKTKSNSQTITTQSISQVTATDIDDYITTNRFYIEMESEVTASFSESSGFGVNLKKETYLEGGVNEQQRVVIGHAEFDDITFKKGMSNSAIFWSWINNTLTATPKKRRNVNILLFNQAGDIIQCWTLIGAIPISWKCPSFQATGTDVAIEELTLSYEGIKVTYGEGQGGASIVTRNGNSGYFPDN